MVSRTIRQTIKKRIESLEKEVNDFHPLLDALFRKLPDINTVEYTHGPNERGADFVLSKSNALFNTTDYIGVVAKSGKITGSGEFRDLREQITECQEPRFLESGKKTVHLTEIWIAATGTISNRAQEKIQEAYKTSNIRFLPIGVISDLVESYLPDFGENIELQIGQLLSKQKSAAEGRERKFSLLPLDVDDLYVEPEILRIERESEFGQDKKTKVDVYAEIEARRVLILQAQMGSGKSKCLNKIVMHYSQPDVFIEKKYIPLYFHCSELLTNSQQDLNGLITHISEEHNLPKDGDYTFLFVVDGLDEAKIKSESVKDCLLSLITQIEESSNSKLILASRTITDAELENTLYSHATQYQILPLSLNRIQKFIELICSTYNKHSRLTEDLKHSSLFQVLPKTPIAAIILAKLISENSEELPSNITDLYSQFTEYSLGRWDSEKGLNVLKEYEAADSILANLAKYMLDNELPAISVDEAQSFFNKYLSERNFIDVDAKSLFGNLLERSEILVLDELKGVISFKHRSFAEFFYGKHLASLPDSDIHLDKEIFHPYWSNSYFFYVGLKKDCPHILNEIINIKTPLEVQRIAKIHELGKFLLAGYKTPYDIISKGLKVVFDDASLYFDEVSTNSIESQLSKIPPIHFLAFLRHLLSDGYSYRFFEHAILELSDQLVSLPDLNDNDVYSLFFMDAALEETCGSRVYENLEEVCGKSLPKTLEVALCATSASSSHKSTVLRKLEKRVRKQARQSSQYRGYINSLFQESMDKTTKFNRNGKRLESLKK